MSRNFQLHERLSLTPISTVFPSDLAAGIIGDGVFPKSKIPAERSGTEEDMAGCILFLTSRAGAYCSGNVLVVDGGRLSLMPSTY
jgi:NAD(P)-dependent dehydrogenase (short-subunit alcohol dehydrogenase family)